MTEKAIVLNGKVYHGCSHGVPWSQPCIRCEKVSVEHTLSWMGPRVTSARARLDEIEAILSREEGSAK